MYKTSRLLITATISVASLVSVIACSAPLDPSGPVAATSSPQPAPRESIEAKPNAVASPKVEAPATDAAPQQSAKVSELVLKGVRIGEIYAEPRLREMFGHVTCKEWEGGRTSCDVATTVFGQESMLTISRDPFDRVSRIRADLGRPGAETEAEIPRLLAETYGPRDRFVDSTGCSIWSVDEGMRELISCGSLLLYNFHSDNKPPVDAGDI